MFLGEKRVLSIACSVGFLIVIGSCKTVNGSRQKSIGAKVSDGLDGMNEIRLYSTADGSSVCMIECPEGGFTEQYSPKNKSRCKMGALSSSPGFSGILADVKGSLASNGKNYPDITWAAIGDFLKPQSELRQIQPSSDKQPIFVGIAEKFRSHKDADFGPEKIDDGLDGQKDNPSWRACSNSVNSVGSGVVMTGESSPNTVAGAVNNWGDEGGYSGYITRKIKLINAGANCSQFAGEEIILKVAKLTFIFDDPEWSPKDLEDFIVTSVKERSNGKRSMTTKCSTGKEKECDEMFLQYRGIRIPVRQLDNKPFAFSGVEMLSGKVTESPNSAIADHTGKGYLLRMVVSGQSCAKFLPVGGGMAPGSQISAPCIQITTPNGENGVCGFAEN